MKNNLLLTALLAMVLFDSCSVGTGSKGLNAETNKVGQRVYLDKPFLQDYSIKFYFPAGHQENTKLVQVVADRNHNIQISSSAGLLTPYNGHFQAPGELLPVKTYRYMQHMPIDGIIAYQNQFVYAGDHALFSNAWAGNLYLEHGLNKPALFS